MTSSEDACRNADRQPATERQPAVPPGREPVLREGDTCWCIARADRMAVIIDACDYFAAVKQALLQARHSVLLIGWDFDLRINLTHEDPGFEGTKDQLGAFLRALLKRRPQLRVNVLKWDMAVLFTMSGQALQLFRLGTSGPKRFRLRFDSDHPWMAAHHQKIAVIDDEIAFCGGIDMTTDRWDTRDHLPNDERRRTPDGRISGPWHDATTAVDGEAARRLGELARWRWKAATGEDLPQPPREVPIWPKCLEPQFRDIDVGIARTLPAFEGRPAVREIESFYLAAIAAAKKTIYLESQYFASMRICSAIAERLREPDGPEIVVINPNSSEGWLEEETMDIARSICLQEVREADLYDRFRIYFPVNAEGEPIYVHAKILIVDDRILRVGSSNINNRSMGFDTECDLAIDAASPEEEAGIREIRESLLAEHLGSSPPTVRQKMKELGLRRAVEELADHPGKTLRRLLRQPPNAMERAVWESRFADPERPRSIETRLVHLAKRLAIRLPPEAALGAAGLAGLGLYFWRQNRRNGRRDLSPPERRAAGTDRRRPL